MCAQRSPVDSASLSTVTAGELLGLQPWAVRRLVEAGVLAGRMDQLPGRRRSYLVDAAAVHRLRDAPADDLDRLRTRLARSGGVSLRYAGASSENGELLSTSEAADLLGVSPLRVRQLIDLGQLTPHSGRYPAGRRWFALEHAQVLALRDARQAASSKAEAAKVTADIERRAARRAVAERRGAARQARAAAVEQARVERDLRVAAVLTGARQALAAARAAETAWADKDGARVAAAWLAAGQTAGRLVAQVGAGEADRLLDVSVEQIRERAALADIRERRPRRDRGLRKEAAALRLTL